MFSVNKPSEVSTLLSHSESQSRNSIKSVFLDLIVAIFLWTSTQTNCHNGSKEKQAVKGLNIFATCSPAVSKRQSVMEDVPVFPVNVYMLKNLKLRPQAFSCRGLLLMPGYAIKASPGPVKAPGTVHDPFRPFQAAQKHPTWGPSTAVHRCEALINAEGTGGRPSVCLCTQTSSNCLIVNTKIEV